MMPNLLSIPLSHQAAILLLLSFPVACISWSVTHEEIFREPRDFCREKSKSCRPFYIRKFFYLFTCEYCFSHYVTALLLLVTQFQVVYQGWRGFIISEFALVWIANIHMAVFNRVRLDIKHENLTIAEQTQDKEVRRAA